MREIFQGKKVDLGAQESLESLKVLLLYWFLIQWQRILHLKTKHFTKISHRGPGANSVPNTYLATFFTSLCGPDPLLL